MQGFFFSPIGYISGASITGPALAHWLHGFDVTVIERSPALRPGGYGGDIRRPLQCLGGWIYVGLMAAGSMVEKSNFKIFLHNLVLRVPLLMVIQFKLISKMVAKAANGIELEDY